MSVCGESCVFYGGIRGYEIYGADVICKIRCNKATGDGIKTKGLQCCDYTPCCQQAEEGHIEQDKQSKTKILGACGAISVSMFADNGDDPLAETAPKIEMENAILNKCGELADMLCEKNRKYGNSALEPCRIFSRANTYEQLLVRLDDKLSRLKNRQNDEDEDVLMDIAGYMILLLIAREKCQ